MSSDRSSTAIHGCKHHSSRVVLEYHSHTNHWFLADAAVAWTWRSNPNEHDDPVGDAWPPRCILYTYHDKNQQWDCLDWHAVFSTPWVASPNHPWSKALMQCTSEWLSVATIEWPLSSILCTCWYSAFSTVVEDDGNDHRWWSWDSYDEHDNVDWLWWNSSNCVVNHGIHDWKCENGRNYFPSIRVWVASMPNLDRRIHCYQAMSIVWVGEVDSIRFVAHRQRLPDRLHSCHGGESRRDTTSMLRVMWVDLSNDRWVSSCA